MQLQLSPGLWL